MLENLKKVAFGDTLDDSPQQPQRFTMRNHQKDHRKQSLFQKKYVS